MNNVGKNVALWLVIAVLLISLFNLFQNQTTRTTVTEIPYSAFLTDVDAHKITSVTIRGQQISGVYEDGHQYSTFAPEQTDIIARIGDKGEVIKAMPEEGPNFLTSILLSWGPMILIAFFWFYMLRQMQSGNGKAMGFGKSRARLMTEKTGRVTFEDVAGIDEAKAELEESC